MQLYTHRLQSTPSDGILPKEVGNEVTFNPLMVMVELRVSQHDFFQFSPSDEMTVCKCDHDEVCRVLDNGYVEMKLSNSVSVAPFL